MAQLETEACLRLQVQANEAQPSRAKPDVAWLEADGTLSLKVKDISAADLIKQIATVGKLQVLVAPGATGRIWFINIQGKTPEQALRMVAQVMRWQVQQHGAVFFLRKAQPGQSQDLAQADEPQADEPQADEPTVSLSAKEIAVRYLAELLAQDTKATFENEVVGQGVTVEQDRKATIEVEEALGDRLIPFIKLSSVSVRAALDNIALLLDAQVAWKEGRYILSAKAK